MGKTLRVLLFLVIAPAMLLAQGTFKVSGKVTDTNGETLIGASVIIKALNTGAASDLDGNYSFDIPKELAKGQRVELSASFVNYKKGSVSITLSGNNITQNFELVEDVFLSDELVVTGIASKTSKSVAEIAVGRVSAAELQQVNTYGSLSQLVGGKVAGVQLTTSSGNVGSGWRFNVRGGGGLNGDGQPIIYVDGVRMDNQEVVGFAVGGQGISTLANLNTNDIEKIEFLKGPAAASMYGANGSNGVVLITTKSGKLTQQVGAGISVDYRFNYGYNEKLYTYDYENFETVQTWVVKNAATKELTRVDKLNSQFKVGPIREHFLSATGGNNAMKYYSSFENRQEDGIYPGNSGDRSTVRLNLTAFPTDAVTLKLSSGYVKNKFQRPNNDNIIYGGLGNTILDFRPFAFVKEEDLYKFSDNHDLNQFVGSFSMNYRPMDNLDVNASIGIDNSSWRQVRLFPFGVNFGGLITQGQKSIFERFNTQFTYDFNVGYNYQLFEDLDIRSVVGGQFFDRTNKSTNVTGETFTSELITTLGAAGKISGYGEGFSHLRDGGIFTEHSFNYLDQYFLTLGLRKDYASSLGANSPSITYPKASLAVRLDRYDFTPSFFNLLKLRAAYGESGVLPGLLDGIPLLYAAEAGGYGAGAVISVIGNPEIQPERVKEFEVGLDTELFGDISLEFTYYIQKATNSIVGKVNAPSTGLTASTQPFNVGAVDASGFESLIQYSPIRTADYKLDLSFIWNYQKNEVKDLGGAQPIYSINNVIHVGKPKYEFFTFTSIAAEYDAAGKYLRSTRSTDRVELGNPVPNHTGSFTLNFKFLKNFNLYAFTEWALGNRIFNNTQLFANRRGNGSTYNRMNAQLGLAPIVAANATLGLPSSNPTDVTPLTPGTDEYKALAEKFAKLDWRYAGNYVEDADYLIIREVSLSYDLTDVLSEFDLTRYFKAISVGVSVRNLARFTKYSGSDVELNFTGARTIARGNDFLTLQSPRTVNFWFRLGL
ncbi:MAG: TonB-dependent receptor plug [Ignavibacteria bacterium]|nr:MAG: TonB-dependent receptor plug [Ignavibacteria bacterium]KAF0160568.1 MAG: TonB-dependent receptor plug [Ignavibacteria bacterium]